MYISYETFLQILWNFLSFKVPEEYVRNFNFASRLSIFHSKKDISREGSLSFHTWHESSVYTAALYGDLLRQAKSILRIFNLFLFCLSVCLFVWLVCLFVRFISSHSRMETSPLTVKGSKFWRNSALMATEQWGFFTSHSYSVTRDIRLYGYVWWLVTFQPIAKHWRQ